MLYSVYEISRSVYGVLMREKTCVIAHNLRGQVPDIIFLRIRYLDFEL